MADKRQDFGVNVKVCHVSFMTSVPIDVKRDSGGDRGGGQRLNDGSSSYSQLKRKMSP